MSFFTGGGATLTFGDTRDPSSFPQYGNRWRGGQIVEVKDPTPQTDMTTGAVIMDKGGRPKEQLPVTLLCDGSGPAAQAGMRTDERNPNDHTDLGRRTIYVKGSLRFSIGDALRAAGADDIEIGGYLFLMWVGMGKTGNSSFVGRTWQVHYIKPSGAFFQQTADAASPQHTGFAPTQTPATAPPQQGYVPAQGVPVAPPNPYGQHNPPGSPAHTAAQQYTAQQQGANAWPAAAPPVPDQHHVPAPESPAPQANPWGGSPDPSVGVPTPYGPSQGAPAAPPAANPWQQ